MIASAFIIAANGRMEGKKKADGNNNLILTSVEEFQRRNSVTYLLIKLWDRMSELKAHTE